MSNAEAFAVMLNSRARALAILGCGALVLAGPLAAPSPAPGVVEIQILQVSDWHGQLDPIKGSGAASVLSRYFEYDRAENPNTLTLAAGDSIGASPPLASFFGEYPAVRALNMMGLDADTLGNHNFDRGLAHLRGILEPDAPLQHFVPADHPGCSVSGPPSENPCKARYATLAANVEDPENALPSVKDFEIFELQGVKVAVIGIMNEEAPSLLLPGAMGALTITDSVAAANEARADAAAAGADVFVVLTHKGLTFQNETEARGPLVDFANALPTGDFDVILGDHTDFEYHHIVNGAHVIEAKSKGLSYSRTILRFDVAAGQVLPKANEDSRFVYPVVAGIIPDLAIEAMLAPYRDALAAAFDAPIARVSEEFPRGGNVERVQEVAIGNLVTDAIREAYGVQLAFTNGGGIRAPLPSGYLPRNYQLHRPVRGYLGGPPYDLVVGDVFTVLPFGNTVVTRTVTGAELYAILEHSVSSLPAAVGKFAQISGFSFRFDTRLPPGSRVVAVTLHPDAPNGTLPLADTAWSTVAGDRGGETGALPASPASSAEARSAAETVYAAADVARGAGPKSVSLPLPPALGGAKVVDARIPYGIDAYVEYRAPCPQVAPPSVCAGDIVVKGRPGIPILRDNTTYTLATNNFVDAGGDGYTMLVGTGDPVTRDVMANVVLDHVRRLTGAWDPDGDPIEPSLEDRIVDLAPTFAKLERTTGPLPFECASLDPAWTRACLQLPE